MGKEAKEKQRKERFLEKRKFSARCYLVNPAGMPTSHPADAPKETIPTWN